MQPAPNRPPEIPGYRLLEKIGEGGKGEVYRAQQEPPLRQVAIKFLYPFPSEQLTAEFQREAELMAALAHPNIVAILDCGKVADRFYIVMEYVAGSTLRSFMKPRQPWTVARARPILNGITDALSYIHGQDILHLDLKPENVLCGLANSVKLTDFGLAHWRVDAWTLSELGLVQASLDYCSPEQRYGLPVDQRSDLFSLATLTYELLTGNLPSRVFVPCTQRNPTLPSATDGVLAKALQRDPDERYSSVDLFRRDLIAALDSEA
jgi:serine/threonine-protein kinase